MMTGLVEKLMNAMIDFCYVCIESQNVPQTLKILEEALNLLDVSRYYYTLQTKNLKYNFRVH